MIHLTTAPTCPVVSVRLCLPSTQEWSSERQTYATIYVLTINTSSCEGIRVTSRLDTYCTREIVEIIQSLPISLTTTNFQYWSLGDLSSLTGWLRGHETDKTFNKTNRLGIQCHWPIVHDQHAQSE